MHRIASRRALLLALSLFAAACATEPRPYVAPVDKPLQDPLPGQAIVYLLRAPHDSLRVQVSSAEQRLAVLAQSTYTAVSLQPGRHLLRTHAWLLAAGAEVAPPLELDVQPNTRRFFNLSGATVRFVYGVPLPQVDTAPGSRSWKEVSELDAQGLMSITRVTLPDQGAL
jgi:hypothetical protein